MSDLFIHLNDDGRPLNTNEKQRRFDKLCAKENKEEFMSDDEITEQTRLFYELYPDEWATTLAGKMGQVPSDIWPAKKTEQ